MGAGSDCISFVLLAGPIRSIEAHLQVLGCRYLVKEHEDGVSCLPIRFHGTGVVGLFRRQVEGDGGEGLRLNLGRERFLRAGQHCGGCRSNQNEQFLHDLLLPYHSSSALKLLYVGALALFWISTGLPQTTISCATRSTSAEGASYTELTMFSIIGTVFKNVYEDTFSLLNKQGMYSIHGCPCFAGGPVPEPTEGPGRADP